MADVERERVTALWREAAAALEEELAWDFGGAGAKRLEAAEAECGRLREQLDAARQALQELLDWSSRMPDAGFNSESPRWQWWHERPAAAARAALGVEGEQEKPQ